MSAIVNLLFSDKSNNIPETYLLKAYPLTTDLYKKSNLTITNFHSNILLKPGSHLSKPTSLHIRTYSFHQTDPS